MNKLDFFNSIKGYSGNFNENRFKKKFPSQYDLVKKYFNSYIKVECSFKEQIYCWVYDYIPLCKEGNKRSFISFNKGFYNGCGKPNSCKCAKIQYEKTMMEKYGVTSPLKSKELFSKMEESLLEKYNTKKLSEVNIDKKHKTNISKYGSKTPLESDKIRDKIKQSYHKSNGVEYPFQNQDIQDSIQKYWFDTNGKKSYVKTKEDGEKYSREYLIKKYSDKSKYLLDKKLLESTLKSKSPRQLSEFIGCNESLIYKKIVDYDINFERSKSYYENEVCNFLDSIGVTYIRNTRKVISPKEIDILIEDKKLGIEFNGLYYHSEISGGKDRNYHKNKTLEANKNGYELIHIFSDEWRDKEEIIKSIIKIKLGLGNRIYARNTILKEVNESDSKLFLKNNHLQGNVIGSNKRYGLYYKDELVSLMTFQLKDTVWELKRFVNKLNTNIIGGASKLFKHFIKENNPVEIFSYCDLRYFNGNVYKQLGFQFEKNTSPGFFYVKNEIRYNRMNFTKKKLISDGYNPNKSGWEIMQDLNYDRIWDCGHGKWIKK